MAFTQDARNRLARFVTTTRRLLADDFTRQLQNDYGLNPDSGDIADIATLDRLDDARRSTGVLLHGTAAHYLVSADQSTPAKAKKARQDALSRIVREQAFTLLNRLCALRMAEARGLLLESIAKGYDSQGFQLYRMVAGPALGETGEAYRAFLFSIFDEFAVDLSVLFDRFSPTGRLFPKESTLLAVLDEINHHDLASLWGEDETIGWIYQYFNSIEERREMRAASSAPRNSRELAVRNQFFTPRYVVEFLTDNTLGRLWYEMTKGETRLVERCRYLVKAAGDGTPALPDGRARTPAAPQPALTPRPLKDPREIRMLDPACGSMHFGLYAFDLFEVIYEEAWDLEEKLGAGAFARTTFQKSLHETYASRETFLLDVPRLILENNIHGVDIDPRATQIAGLSLWLRAQRAWKDRGVKPADRPQIRRANVVCAEPMPGEEDLLNDFADKLRPKVLGQLLKLIFQKMKLAGEAGSLLRIEEDIKSEIAEAHRAYLAAEEQEKADDGYLAGLAPKSQQLSLFDFSDLPKREDFWATAEQRLVAALRDYAEDAADNAGMKRLFAADAARGFALIDLLSKRYDVSLQNPPFGEFSAKFKTQSRVIYPNTYNDIYAAFIERSLELLVPGGMLGAITSRTGFFLGSFLKWRENVLLGQSTFRLMADLGGAVMDAAMVESAAYCLEKVGLHISRDRIPAVFFRMLGKADRARCLEENVSAVNRGDACGETFVKPAQDFTTLPSTPFAYWMDSDVLKKVSSNVPVQDNVCNVCQGLVTGDNVRFMRAMWEVSWRTVSRHWFPYVLAGSSQPWYSPLTVYVDWKYSGRVFHFLKTCRLGNEKFFFQPGMSWTRRAVRFIPYAIPNGCIPSASRYMIFPTSGKESTLLGLLGSNVASAVLRCNGEWYTRPNFLVDSVKQLAWPGDALVANEKLRDYVSRQILARRAIYRGYEPFQEFVCPAQLTGGDDAANPLAFDFNHLLPPELDDEVAAAYGFSPEEAKAICRDLFEAIENRNGSSGGEEEDDEGEEDEGNPLGEDVSTANFKARAIVSYAVGCALGRWDIAYATGAKTAEMSDDPFAPLPAQSPGCLTDEEFARVVSGGAYPITLPKDGVLADETGPDGLVRRVQNILTVLFGEAAPAKEQELAKALGVRELADYLTRPNGFFADHLLTYTKSRRSAPIYWPLSTKGGAYTLWVYYQRINAQTLYTCVNDFVEPKLSHVQEELAHLKGKALKTSAEEDELEKLYGLEDELKDFREELLRIAKFWKPDLNDGVQITAAPLWRLFRMRAWQQKLKKTWESLEAGTYDWSHLALGIWPERVIEAARKDRSIAIAHDLENRLWEEVEVTRRGRKVKEWRPQALSAEEVAEIVKEVKLRN